MKRIFGCLTFDAAAEDKIKATTRENNRLAADMLM
jgi:hypothetical protein